MYGGTQVGKIDGSSLVGKCLHPSNGEHGRTILLTNREDPWYCNQGDEEAEPAEVSEEDQKAQRAADKKRADNRKKKEKKKLKEAVSSPCRSRQTADTPSPLSEHLPEADANSGIS